MVHEEVTKFIISFLISGAISAVTKTILAPIDRIKLILQNQDASLQIIKGRLRPYSGIWDIVTRIPAEEGFLSFWRGNTANLLRVISYQAFGFALYDYFKFVGDVLRGPDQPPRPIDHYFAGGASGALSICLVYPLEFCQTRMATDVGIDKSKKVKREFYNLRHCILRVYKYEGIRGYYYGMSAKFIGAFVYRALYFGLYDHMKKIACYNNVFKVNDVDTTSRIFIAMCATTVANSVSYPLDTISRRLMLDSARPIKYQKCNRSMIVATKNIFREDGLKGFYRGQIVNILRGFGSSLVLAFYDEVLQRTAWKEKVKNYYCSKPN